MKSLLLSYAIGNKTPFYIGTTAPSVKPNTQIKDGDDYNTYTVKVGNHCGTHVDAPKHFVDTGKPIIKFDVGELTMKNPIIIQCPKEGLELVDVEDIAGLDLENYDAVLFKTGFGRYRESDLEKYLTQNPGISSETVHYIRENYPNIRCLGIDSISISRYQDDENAKKTHITAFKDVDEYGDPLLLIEDMDLSGLSDLNTIEEMLIVPWQIIGVDSAPCTVVAVLK
jgi:arylformamidase